MEEKGLPSALPQGEGGCKSHPHFKIAFFAYVYVYPVIFTGGGQLVVNYKLNRLSLSSGFTPRRHPRPSAGPECAERVGSSMER